MTKPKTYTTTTGRRLTDVDIDAIAVEVEHREYDTETLKTRRRGRPLLGSGPAEVVPVRLDPELKSAVEERRDRTTHDERTLSAGPSATTSTSRARRSCRLSQGRLQSELPAGKWLDGASSHLVNIAVELVDGEQREVDVQIAVVDSGPGDERQSADRLAGQIRTLSPAGQGFVS
ncbi:MAG: hypothetical protein IPG97_14140 [Microthrixaceae bacterium]|nr:hypothetical protein [Microthrixaceae bacterium]